MKIGIDAFPLVGPKVGFGQFVHHMVSLWLARGGHELYFYNTQGRLASEYPGVHYAQLKPVWLDRSSTFWMVAKGAKELSADMPDVFWGSQGFLPLRMPRGIRKVITVHDAVYYTCPWTMSAITHFTFGTFLEQSIKRADALTTVSQTMKTQLEKILHKKGIKKNLEVIYPGADDLFRPLDKEFSREHLFSRHGIREPFLLFVGTCEPRKNLVGLIRAFRLFLKKASDYTLVIAGGKGWKDAPIYAEVNRHGLKDRVKFLGYVPQDDLPKLYSAAEAFIFVSFYEGFGIPNLEAMACGTPIVASDIPVFREVLKDAAFFVRPDDPQDIAKGIETVISNSILRAELIRKGSIRVQDFSWERSSQQMRSFFSATKFMR